MDKQQNSPVQSVGGLKSGVNNANLAASTGYNSMTGEYTSSQIQQKSSKEGATFAEYPQTSSVGIKSTVSQSAKPNLSTSTGYSMEGEYVSTSNKSEQKTSKEGATFAEYPPTSSTQGIKSSQLAATSMTANQIQHKTSKEGATFAEYPPTSSTQGIKSSQLAGNKPNLTASTGYNSMTGEYTSSQIQQKSSKEGATFAEYPQTSSVGIKSTVSQSVNPNLNTSTGYSMDGAYTSTTVNNISTKSSKEGATFSEYPQTSSTQGIKSSLVAQSTEVKPNLTASTGYNSMTGEYLSTSNIQTKSSKEGATFKEYPMTASLNASQPLMTPVLINAPVQVPIINPNIPLGAVQTKVTVTKTTVTTTGPSQFTSQNINQTMPIGQPLPGATFSTYPSTSSANGIKSTNASLINQPQ